MEDDGAYKFQGDASFGGRKDRAHEDSAVFSGKAPICKGTVLAEGLFAADEGTKFHHGLVMLPGTAMSEKAICQFCQGRFAFC